MEWFFYVLDKLSRGLVEFWKIKVEKRELVEVVSEMCNLIMDMLWEVLFNFFLKNLRYEIYRLVELGVSYIGMFVFLFVFRWMFMFINW